MIGIVHPTGSSSFGYLKCTYDMSHLTKAILYSKPGKQTLVRLHEILNRHVWTRVSRL